MCDFRTGTPSAAPVRPHWGVLSVSRAALGTATLVAECAVPAGFWRVATRWSFAALAFATMAFWVRYEAVALSAADRSPTT